MNRRPRVAVDEPGVPQPLLVLRPAALQEWLVLASIAARYGPEFFEHLAAQQHRTSAHELLPQHPRSIGSYDVLLAGDRFAFFPEVKPGQHAKALAPN